MDYRRSIRPLEQANNVLTFLPCRVEGAFDFCTNGCTACCKLSVTKHNYCVKSVNHRCGGCKFLFYLFVGFNQRAILPVNFFHCVGKFFIDTSNLFKFFIQARGSGLVVFQLIGFNCCGNPFFSQFSSFFVGFHYCIMIGAHGLNKSLLDIITILIIQFHIQSTFGCGSGLLLARKVMIDSIIVFFQGSF